MQNYKKVISPISGMFVAPKVVVKMYNGKKVTELHYIDPKTNTLFSKITLN